MKYRCLNDKNELKEIEVNNIDLALDKLIETSTGRTIYKNDIIRIDGVFSHTIWWNATKRSSGKPSKSYLEGYAIYKVLEGGDLSYKKFELLKCDNTLYNQPGNVYYLRECTPLFFDWDKVKEVKILGNMHKDNLEKILSLNSLSAFHQNKKKEK